MSETPDGFEVNSESRKPSNAKNPDPDDLAGTPIRPIGWLCIPSLALLLGGAGIVEAAIQDLGLAGWTVLGSSIVLIGVGGTLGWLGFAAYSHMTVKTTVRFVTASAAGAGISSGAIMVAGIFTGTSFWVIVGVAITVLLSRRSSDVKAPLSARFQRNRLGERFVFALWLLLLACTVTSAIIALVNPFLSEHRRVSYLGGGDRLHSYRNGRLCPFRDPTEEIGTAT